MKRAVITIVLLSASLAPCWGARGGRARAEDRVESAAKGAAKEVEGAAKETIGKKVDATKEAVEDSVDSAKKQAQEAAEGAAERAKEQAQEAVESLSEHAQEMAESAKDLADELVVSARERAALLAAGAVGVGAKIKTDAGDLLQRARDEARRALIGMAAALDNRAQESRLAARNASWAKLKARFLLAGDRPSPELSEELGDHEYRLARLERAKELASGVGDRSGVARCERMMEAEYARHKRRLDQMRKRQHQHDVEARAAARQHDVEARGSSAREPREEEARGSSAREPREEATQ